MHIAYRDNEKGSHNCICHRQMSTCSADYNSSLHTHCVLVTNPTTNTASFDVRESAFDTADIKTALWLYETTISHLTTSVVRFENQHHSHSPNWPIFNKIRFSVLYLQVINVSIQVARVAIDDFMISNSWFLFSPLFGSTYNCIIADSALTLMWFVIRWGLYVFLITSRVNLLLI